MTLPRLVAMLLLGAVLAVPACGKKGEPIPPGEEATQEDVL